ncbi:FDLD family class I lanthipeptide [Tumebacillus permanentifrigoris]|uniref:Uncharacterized protein n=1 Tax=Tumebacillus permanentifrigoris TaxID=378543 RepID=A0A316DBQ6_9BACL|nr:FDLD family class I lanthipeptide [Tumebacillus permanentifrigoris]PWK15006.1 hypothetical protein C7459_104212 [Tumebacillus permanentifrigoris]
MEKMFDLDVQVKSPSYAEDGGGTPEYTYSCLCTISGCW